MNKISNRHENEFALLYGKDIINEVSKLANDELNETSKILLDSYFDFLNQRKEVGKKSTRYIKINRIKYKKLKDRFKIREINVEEEQYST